MQVKTCHAICPRLDVKWHQDMLSWQAKAAGSIMHLTWGCTSLLHAS